MEPTTSEFILVKHSTTHNKGVFAAKDIPKNTGIIQYVGERVTKKEGDRRAVEQLETSEKNKGKGYIFSLNKQYDIDGDVPYNTARFINHSCAPNCEPEVYEKKEIWIIAKRAIKKGEELSYDYGWDLEGYEDHPCKCKAQNCRGYIVGERFVKKLKMLLKRQKKRNP